MRRSASKIPAKIVDVLDTIGHVGPVLPHTIKRKIPNRAGFSLQAFGVRRDPHLDDSSFVDSHVLKRLKDAVFVLCADGHARTEPRPSALSPIYWILGFMLTLLTDRSLPTVFPVWQHKNADAGCVATPNHSPSEVEDAEIAVGRFPPMRLALTKINR